MDLGPHAAFIWLSYAFVALALAGLIAWLIVDGKSQQSALDDLEQRGIKRGTRAPGAPGKP